MNFYDAITKVSTSPKDYNCEHNCCEFANRVVRSVLPEEKTFYSCTDWDAYLSNNSKFKRVTVKEANTDCIIFFSWDKTQSRPVDHVGIVAAKNDKTIYYANMNGSKTRAYSIDNKPVDSKYIWSIYKYVGDVVDEPVKHPVYIKRNIKIIYGDVTNTLKPLQKIFKLDEIDGEFGPLTLKALNEFQEKNNLEICEMISEETYKKILESEDKI